MSIHVTVSPTEESSTGISVSHKPGKLRIASTIRNINVQPTATAWRVKFVSIDIIFKANNSVSVHAF